MKFIITATSVEKDRNSAGGAGRRAAVDLSVRSLKFLKCPHALLAEWFNYVHRKITEGNMKKHK